MEETIVGAVKGLLSGRVNELLAAGDDPMPPIEFAEPRFGGCMAAGGGVAPEITLAQGERDVKDRVVGVEAYDLTVGFQCAGERECYGYAAAVSGALRDDPTLGGAADRAVLARKKYTPPRQPCCGDLWELVLTLRITVEN
jgi:hypothetical protein